MIRIPLFLRRMMQGPTLAEMRPLYLYDKDGWFHVAESIDDIPNGATVWEYRASSGPMEKEISHRLETA